MRLGFIHFAGNKYGFRPAEIVEPAANNFGLDPLVLSRLHEYLELEDHPTILLLQAKTSDQEVSAACFVSSVWSHSYQKLANPYGKVHRDYYYQVLFSAVAALVEVGCEVIRIENPMTGYAWKRDAYVCLVEATNNIKKLLNPDIKFYLQDGTFSNEMVMKINSDIEGRKLIMNNHEPVPLTMFMEFGLNFRKVWVGL